MNFPKKLVLIPFLALVFGCTKKAELPAKVKELQEKGIELLERSEKLEAEIKNTVSDEGKQNLLRHELELNKSRVLRLKEQLKAANGGVELPVELPPKEKEGGGGH